MRPEGRRASKQEPTGEADHANDADHEDNATDEIIARHPRGRIS